MSHAYSPTTAPKRAVAAATWHFGKLAVEEAARVLSSSSPSLSPPSLALDAVEAGVNRVETDNQEQYYVGYGGFPNSEGDMELDAAIMCGTKRTYGAVCALQGTIKAISVARRVMEKSVHSVLVGKGASTFAREQGGFEWEEVLSPEAREGWMKWKEEEEEAAKNRLDGKGDDGSATMPTAAPTAAVSAAPIDDSSQDTPQHDTIGLLVMDAQGHLAAGTSTSGWRFKHPGRVGDSPLVGSGLYADNSVGAAVATGDGEEIMRVCLSFLVVEKMREGLPPAVACQAGIKRLKEVVEGVREGEGGRKTGMHEALTVAVLAMDKEGRVGAASTLGENNEHRGRPAFPFVVWREGEGAAWVEEANDEGTD
ncbi:n-(beta-n-acetylglucosaminyl)-l-asparaginase [Nannochloropsis oceanica]